MKILILPPGELPIPDRMGGAIEGLSTAIIDENEKSKCPFEFTILNRTEVKTFNYKYTKTIWIKQNAIRRCLYLVFYKFIRLISFRKMYLPDYYIHRVNQHLNKVKYDLIIVEGDYLSGLNLRCCSTPIWLHLHTDLLYKGALRAEEAVEFFGRIICVSEFIKKRVEEIPGVNGNNLFVLKNCINTKIFNLSRDYTKEEELKDKLGLCNQAVVMYIGRISKEKGVKELVEAFAKITRKNIKLVIVGSSWFSTNRKDQYGIEVEGMVKKLKIEEKVIFTGYVEHSEMAPYYHIADCIVVPSICNESASLVGVEAQCCGCRIVASRRGGIPEYIHSDCLVEENEMFTESLALKIEKMIEGYACNKIDIQYYSSERYYMEFCNIIKH